MESKYLPIGSVILLKNHKKIMVIGYYSISYKNAVKMYDYLGCSYPEGMLLINDLISFNHDEIEELLFTGYSDESYNQLNSNMNGQLEQNYDNINKNNFSLNIGSSKDGSVVYNNEKKSLIDPIYDILDNIEIDNPFKKDELKENVSTEVPIVDTVAETVTSNKLFTIEPPANEEPVTVQ